MKPTVIAWDIDDVIHPFSDLAHQSCVIAGLVPEGTPNPGTWAPYESYGCTLEEWVDVLALATETGFLHGSTPSDEVFDVFGEFHQLGYTQHFITARGFMAHGDLVRQLTETWVSTHFAGQHESLHFAKDKGAVAKRLGVTHAIDDNYSNYQDFERVGVEVYLMNQPWNADADVPESRRVKSVGEFGLRVLKGIYV